MKNGVTLFKPVLRLAVANYHSSRFFLTFLPQLLPVHQDADFSILGVDKILWRPYTPPASGPYGTVLRTELLDKSWPLFYGATLLLKVRHKQTPSVSLVADMWQRGNPENV